MRLGVKDVKLPLGIALDGWEVLLGGGLACVVVGAAEKMRVLVWIGIGLIVIWVITVFLVNLGILRPITRKKKAKEGGGTASKKTKPAKGKKS